MSSPSHIYSLIAQGEHQELDFKYEVEDARKIAKSISAFANTDGGRLLIGVKDNGKIAGIDSEEEMYVIEAAAEMYCDPPIALKAHLHHLEGKDVLEVIIPVSDQKHRSDVGNGKKVAFIRYRDMNLQASRVQVRIWELLKEKIDKRFVYGKSEEKLFAYLRENDWITFSKYCKITRLHYRKATEKMARMVLWDVLDMDYSEKGTFFGIGEKSEELINSSLASEQG